MSFHDEEPQTKGFDPAIARRLLGYLRPCRKQLILAIVLVLSASGISLIGPLITRMAVDDFIMVGNMRGLDLITLVWLLVLCANWFISDWRIRTMSWIGQKVVHSIRRDLFDSPDASVLRLL